MNVRNKVAVACLAASSLTFGFAGSVSAAPAVPQPPANANGVENGAGIGCDMGKFHSETARAGGIGKNRGHYPGQHKGAAICK